MVPKSCHLSFVTLFQDFVIAKLGYSDEKDYIEKCMEEADVDKYELLHVHCKSNALTSTCSPGSPGQKLIDINEFMFGFQFLFKCRDLPLPQYLLAAALWSRYLQLAQQPDAIDWNRELYVKCIWLHDFF